MLHNLRRHPRAIVFSLLLHGLVIVLAVLEFSGEPVKPVVSKRGVVDQTIKAEIIDQKKLGQREHNIKQQQQQKRLQQLAEKRKQELHRKKALERKKKAEAEKKRKAEAAAKKQAEAKKKAEAKRKAEQLEKQKAEQARKQKALAEKKRKEEARHKAEALKKKKEQQRLKAEAEKKAREAARKKAEKEARLKAEAEQRRKEAELKAQLAAEERQRELDSLRNQYYSMIRDKITRNWRQPVNAGSKPLCEVRVIQGPGGIILDVTFGNCPGTREYRLSVEAAVLKSDPLPKPKDPALFERNIILKFKPNE